MRRLPPPKRVVRPSEQTHLAEPIRQCVGCRSRSPKATLVRFVQRAGAWVADPAQRLPGRGAYLCSASCQDRVKKNKRFRGLATVEVREFRRPQDEE